MKQGVFKYIFAFGFIVLLIVAYVMFYDKDNNTVEVQDQTSTVNTLITDLRLGIADFDTINPLISKNKNVKEISKLIFDSLITISNDYKLEYVLASEISKTDNLTYIIKLKENIKWQDGSDFNAQDVKFTIDTIKNQSSIYSSNLENVVGLEIIDNYTIKLMLSRRNRIF